VDFQISITDMRYVSADPPVARTEIDCIVTADPQHHVDDLSSALTRLIDPGADLPQVTLGPELWLDLARLDPAATLGGAGIRDGARLGLGGPPPAPGYRADPGRGVTAEIHLVAGPDAGLVVPVAAGACTVARDVGDVRLADTDVSRPKDGRIAHCVLDISRTSDGITCTVRDCGSTNGTAVERVPVGPEPVPVRPGQLIALGSDLLTIALPPAEQAVIEPAGASDPFGCRVARPARSHLLQPKPVVIDFPTPPSERDRKTSWLAMLVAPAVSLLVGVAVVAVTHEWYFLLLGLGGVVVPLVTQSTGRRATKSQRHSAQREFSEATAASQARMDLKLAEEQSRLRHSLPDPAQLLQIAHGSGIRLWEREPSDADFLRLRTGWADLPAASVSVRGPAGSPGSGQPLVSDVPAATALPAVGVVGLAGPSEISQPALIWAVAQIAALHSPRHVELVLLTNDPAAWTWARWLPHLRSLPGTQAFASIGADPKTWLDRAEELAGLVKARRREAAAPRGAERYRPVSTVVVVLDGSYELSQVPGIASILEDGPAVGVYAICRDDSRSRLPRACRAHLVAFPSGPDRVVHGGTYSQHDQEIQLTRLDFVDGAWAGRLARALAPLRDISGDQHAGLPDSVRLLDLWQLPRPDAAQIAANWRCQGPVTSVPVGRTATGTFTLDIAAQGPHMLVAGMTGAGKSEFLLTLVASLALGNSPDALNFILIDYKGGATFAPIKDLPHVTGLLTDLDDHLTQRAMTALAAEFRYREQLLLDAGCKDLADYRGTGSLRGPLPRLLVVVDEFRFLVKAAPDFLHQFTDMTARGRSIGVHLVLATQRPAGVVNDDIRANTPLRVCLRVEDAAESTAVLESPEAAAIGRDVQGRALVRTQRGSTTLFQSGYVGVPKADMNPEATSLRVERSDFTTLGAALPGGKTGPDGHAGDAPGRLAEPGAADIAIDQNTDLDALTRAIRGTGQEAPGHRPWLPPLPPLLSLQTLRPVSQSAGVPPIGYGLEDRPGEQSQRVISIDLEAGEHLLIVGAPQSGRTTVLRTIVAGIAASISPRDVHLYVLDCGGELGPLAGLPHCGAVVGHTDRERVARLLDRLMTEVSRRRELLNASGFTSVTDQRKASAPSDRLPYMVLLLDRWETFMAQFGEVDYGRLPGLITQLLSAGIGVGLRVLATGDKTAVSRLSSQFPRRLVLRMADKNDLVMAGVPKGAMPENPPPGRGYAIPAGSEVQVAFAGESPHGTAQQAALDAVIKAAEAKDPSPHPAPVHVDVIPSRISLQEARDRGLWREAQRPLCPPVAIGGDDLSPLAIDLDRLPGFTIAGPPLSGRSTALLVIAESLLAAGTTIIGFAPRQSPLRDLAGRPGVAQVFTETKVKQNDLVQLLNSVDGPLAVLVDDAEALHGTEVADVLAQIPDEGRTEGHALVVAGDSEEFVLSQRTFTAKARQFRCGLLLTPSKPQLSYELFTIRLPRSAVFDRPAGRGYLIQSGRQAILAQVPELPFG
jgi:S-DNA-T family DNA segregation ATPase FtsK/SpoIIIE